METNDRFLRQLDILDPKVCKIPIYVIGAGATGSFTILSLAKMGFDNITVFDEDIIEEHNFPNQLYPSSALGKKKVAALKTMVRLFTDVNIKVFPIFYDEQPLKGIVISALDSMKGRKAIFDNCKDEVELLIDPRTGAEMFRLFTVDMALGSERSWYEKTIHSDEVVDEIPCTARTIIYSVLMVSALICKQVKSFCMNQDYKRSVIMDLNNYLLMTP